MIKTVTVCVCDLCQKKVEEEELCRLHGFPVITDCDWTEGKPEKEHVEFVSLDVCHECLQKVTNVRAGFQGRGKKLIQCR